VPDRDPAIKGGALAPDTDLDDFFGLKRRRPEI
jgi:hypothetical protein